MELIKKLNLKIKNYWLLTLIIGWFLSKVLDYYLPINILFIKLPNFIKKIIAFKITVPVVPLILLLIFCILIYRIYIIIKTWRSKLKIISATYGANSKFINITNELNAAISKNKLKIWINNDIAGDPTRHTLKKAEVKYSFKGKEYVVRCNEYELLELPLEKS